MYALVQLADEAILMQLLQCPRYNLNYIKFTKPTAIETFCNAPVCNCHLLQCYHNGWRGKTIVRNSIEM